MKKVILGVYRKMGAHCNYYDVVYYNNKIVKRIYDFEASFLGPDMDGFEVAELVTSLAVAGFPVNIGVESIKQIAYIRHMRIIELTFKPNPTQGE